LEDVERLTPERAEPGRRFAAGQTLTLMAIGAIAGLSLAVTPFLLFSAYVRSFVETATPDSGYNQFTIPAVLCVYLAGVLALVALATAFFKTTRPLGLGYLAGLACGIAVDLVLNATTMH
jgi:hypothetical protein